MKKHESFQTDKFLFISSFSGTKVSPTSSSIFYASSSAAATSSPDFELHLPADCQQICSNTLGSYACSCISGYQLAADRKSCIGFWLIFLFLISVTSSLGEEGLLFLVKRKKKPYHVY